MVPHIYMEVFAASETLLLDMSSSILAFAKLHAFISISCMFLSTKGHI